MPYQWAGAALFLGDWCAGAGLATRLGFQLQLGWSWAGLGLGLGLGPGLELGLSRVQARA